MPKWAGGPTDFLGLAGTLRGIQEPRFLLFPELADFPAELSCPFCMRAMVLQEVTPSDTVRVYRDTPKGDYASPFSPPKPGDTFEVRPS